MFRVSFFLVLQFSVLLLIIPRKLNAEITDETGENLTKNEKLSNDENSTDTERQAKRYSFTDDGLNDNSFKASNPSFIKDLTFTTSAPKNSQVFHHDNIVLLTDNTNSESDSIPVVENYFNNDYPPFESNHNSSVYNKDQSPSAASLINQGYEGFTREAKDYTYSYPYPSSASSSASSSSSFHNDPGTASYYYHNQDDKNYWNTAPPAQDGKPGQMLECYPPSSGFFSELLRLGGIAKVSIVKALLIGVLALLALKIPALLLLKALIFKIVVVPIGLISIMLPVLLPVAYFFWPNLQTALGITTPKPPAAEANSSNGTSTVAPTARGFADAWMLPENLQEILNNFVQSERCLERIACKLGTRDSKSSYRKHVSWLLKKMQVSVDTPLRTKFKHYRDAYNLGASTKEDICDRGLFPCQIPKLILRQSSRTYEIL